MTAKAQQIKNVKEDILMQRAVKSHFEAVSITYSKRRADLEAEIAASQEKLNKLESDYSVCGSRAKSATIKISDLISLRERIEAGTQTKHDEASAIISYLSSIKEMLSDDQIAKLKAI